MEAFFQQVDKLLQLSEEGREAISQKFVRHELPRGRTLIQADTICDRTYFIEQGLARTYYYKDGKDITDWLSAEGDFVVSVISFLTHQRDRRAVELLEPSVLWGISYSDLEQLYHQSHEMERLGRLLVSMGLVQVQQRFDDLHFSSAAERYQHLLQRHSSFIHRVPLGIIASYLGITQETLSRIRSQRTVF